MHKLVFLPLLLLSLVQLAPAWGPAGHQVIARIAAQSLSDKARRGIGDLLDVHSTFTVRYSAALSQIAGKADDIREDRPETKRWHFVNIPLRADNYDPARDCAQTEEGDCVIAAIERQRSVLVDRARSKPERREALMFMVHLVGDLHQPLHAASNKDRGGNDIRVFFVNSEANLHYIWDAGIIGLSGLNATEYAEDVIDKLNLPSAPIQAGDPVQWVMEAHKIAQTNVYAIPGNRKLSQKYAERNTPVVNLQLLRAGIRLARILNDSFE